MGAEGFPLLGFSGILPEGLSGPAPTGGLLSCTNKKVTKEVARGPLPAPWTPGAVVRDLQPLLAFKLEPSSGLSAAWVDTRRPPSLGGAQRRGRSLGVGCSTEGGSWRRGPLRPFGPPPLSKGRLRGACGKPVGGCGKCAWGGQFCKKRRRETEKMGGKSVRGIRTPCKFGWLTKGWGENLEGA